VACAGVSGRHMLLCAQTRRQVSTADSSIDDEDPVGSDGYEVECLSNRVEAGLGVVYTGWCADRDRKVGRREPSSSSSRGRLAPADRRFSEVRPSYEARRDRNTSLGARGPEPDAPPAVY
jgi:hypothetical protein